MARIGTLFVAAFLCLGVLPESVEAATPGFVEPVRIAIIDSGIRASHHAFADGQIVAWFDFSNETPRDENVLWDTAVPLPYDPEGHGTAVASMAAGSLDGLTPSLAPGVELVVARTPLDPRSDARAVRWATAVAGADIVVLSRGASLPIGGWLSPDLADAFEEARARGTLVVQSAGNGLADLGIPSVSWAHRSQADVLIVGGAKGDDPWRHGALARCFPAAGCLPLYEDAGGWETSASAEPEVTANFSVSAACIENDVCVQQMQGTSFGAPYVAGLAASLLAHARAGGRALTPDELEWTIKKVATPHSITDPGLAIHDAPRHLYDRPDACFGPVLSVTACPPSEDTPSIDMELDGTGFVNIPAAPIEGYGYIGADALPRGVAFLDGAPGPSGSDWDFRVWYVETFRGWWSDAWRSYHATAQNVDDPAS